MDQFLRRSWVEINMEQLIQNLNIYRKYSCAKNIIAVVKADAYGHGDIEVMKRLQQHGIDDWAVSNIDEAVRLRDNGCKGQIIILGYTPIDQVERLLKYNITQALLSEEYANALSKASDQVLCQFAIDTGMNRIGICALKVDECERVIREYYKKVRLTGLFTHLCVADNSDQESVLFTEKQITRFKNVTESVGDLNLPYIHCLNSAGGLKRIEMFNDYVRLGIILYGLKPSMEMELPKGIKQCITWKSVVSMIKKIKAGDTVGYGRSFIAKRETIVATIPTGYADGYNRNLSNKGFVIIKGYKAPIIGKVCMDQFMVDVTSIPDVNMGDEVELINDAFTADDMGQMIETIGYEVICSISKRVPRIYIN